jgi:hypothetical protein
VRLIVNLGAAPPEISVAASDASAAETTAGTTPNPGRFTLSRTGDLSSSLTVNIGMTGTATNGADYNTVASGVTFPIGAASVDVPLSIVDDQLVEGTETAILNILSGNGYRVSNAASATVSIQDNDTIPNTLILTPADRGWYDDSGCDQRPMPTPTQPTPSAIARPASGARMSAPAWLRLAWSAGTPPPETPLVLALSPACGRADCT